MDKDNIGGNVDLDNGNMDLNSGNVEFGSNSSNNNNKNSNKIIIKLMKMKINHEAFKKFDDNKNINKIGNGVKGKVTNIGEKDNVKDKTTRVGKIIQLLEGIELYDI